MYESSRILIRIALKILQSQGSNEEKLPKIKISILLDAMVKKKHVATSRKSNK